MYKRFITISVLLGAFLCLPSRPAGADPIVVTAGYLQMTGLHGALSLKGGRGFELSATVGATDAFFAPWSMCNLAPVCGPGTAIDLSATFVGSSLHDATASLDGETFTDVGGINSSSGAEVRFIGSVLPPPVETDTAVVNAPFILAGSFIGRNGAGQTIGGALTGEGIARLSLRRSAIGSAWVYTAARYEFDPIPEPATILLSAAGLAILARRRLRRSITTGRLASNNQEAGRSRNRV